MRVILDTNVLISAVLWRAGAGSPPRLLFEAAIARRISLLLSDSLIEEYSTVLHRPDMAVLHRMPVQEIGRILAKIASAGHLFTPSPAALTPTDPKDQHVVDLACACDDAWLVTGDKPLLRLAESGLRVVSARDALRFLSAP